MKTEELKKCKTCNVDYPLESYQFLIKKTNQLSTRNECIKCRNKKRSSKILERMKVDNDYSIHRKRMMKNATLKKTFGITLIEYENIIEFNKNKCPICNTNVDELSKSPHVDHCHSSNKIRGILCTNCNTGLGLFKDNKEALAKAIKYLLDDGTSISHLITSVNSGARLHHRKKRDNDRKLQKEKNFSNKNLIIKNQKDT